MLGIMGVHAGVYLTAGGFFLLDSFFALVGLPHHLAPDRRVAQDAAPSSWAPSGPAGPGGCCPALLVMLLGVAVIYGIFVPAGTYPTLRGDALSALFYVANWHYIASGSDYFHMTGAHVAADPHLVPRRGGAVLPGVAAGLPGRHEADALVAGAARRCRRRRTSPPRPRWRCSTTRRTSTASTSAPTPTRSPSSSGATLAICLRLWAERRRKGDELNWQARTPWARQVLTVVGCHRSRRQHRLVHHSALRRRLRLPRWVPPGRARRVR